MLFSDQVQVVNVEGVGICIAAIDFVSLVCAKNRRDAHNTITGILKSKDSSCACEILCRKAEVPGFSAPTYVITYDECFELLSFLPRKRVRGIRQYIDRQFARLRAGDQSLHAEVDARASNDGMEAQMARSSLGMPTQNVIQEDPEERAIKRRKMLAEVVRMEKENEEYSLQVAEKNKAAFERLFGKMDQRDEIMLKDSVMNDLYGKGFTAVSNGDAIMGGPSREEITIDEVIKKVGMKPTSALRIKIGKLIARGYRDRYQREPPTCKRWVDGAQRDVKCYLKSDEPWMLSIVREYNDCILDDSD